MIHLSETKPLGTGRHRKCYSHPTDPARCIKVVYNSESGGDKEIKRELGYYRHLSRRLQDWRGLPRYYGTVETDCGTGYVYDAILDFDGKPSVTMTEFAENCHYEEDFRTLRQLLKALKTYLYENRIVTMTLKPQNILCQRISESEVVPVVCDNIGESTFLPVATVCMVLPPQAGTPVAAISQAAGAGNRAEEQRRRRQRWHFSPAKVTA